MTTKGQTALGSLFTLVIIVLVFTGVLTVAYGYISSPALDASDTKSEASIIANHLIYNTLSSDNMVETSQTQTLSPSKVESFFIYRDPTLVLQATNHNVVQDKNIGVNVTMENITLQNQKESLLYAPPSGEKLTAGDELKPGYSSSKRIVLLDGEIAELNVRTWKE